MAAQDSFVWGWSRARALVLVMLAVACGRTPIDDSDLSGARDNAAQPEADALPPTPTTSAEGSAAFPSSESGGVDDPPVPDPPEAPVSVAVPTAGAMAPAFSEEDVLIPPEPPPPVGVEVEVLPAPPPPPPTEDAVGAEFGPMFTGPASRIRALAGCEGASPTWDGDQCWVAYRCDGDEQTVSCVIMDEQQAECTCAAGSRIEITWEDEDYSVCMLGAAACEEWAAGAPTVSSCDVSITAGAGTCVSVGECQSTLSSVNFESPVTQPANVLCEEQNNETVCTCLNQVGYDLIFATDATSSCEDAVSGCTRGYTTADAPACEVSSEIRNELSCQIGFECRHQAMADSIAFEFRTGAVVSCEPLGSNAFDCSCLGEDGRNDPAHVYTPVSPADILDVCQLAMESCEENQRRRLDHLFPAPSL